MEQRAATSTLWKFAIQHGFPELEGYCLQYAWDLNGLKPRRLLETHKELFRTVAKDGKDMQQLWEDLFVNFDVKLRMTASKDGSYLS
jgi:hypothetical protein